MSGGVTGRFWRGATVVMYFKRLVYSNFHFNERQHAWKKCPFFMIWPTREALGGEKKKCRSPPRSSIPHIFWLTTKAVIKTPPKCNLSCAWSHYQHFLGKKKKKNFIKIHSEKFRGVISLKVKQTFKQSNAWLKPELLGGGNNRDDEELVGRSGCKSQLRKKYSKPSCTDALAKVQPGLFEPLQLSADSRLSRFPLDRWTGKKRSHNFVFWLVGSLWPLPFFFLISFHSNFVDQTLILKRGPQDSDE